MNRLSGEIPPELGNLTQLITLQLNANRLTGSIPPEIGDLTQLEILHLTNNRLNGSIPAELGSLSQLERLHLSYNQLTGSIPPELSNLSQLRWLDISANAFSGCVAAELPDLWLEPVALSGVLNEGMWIVRRRNRCSSKLVDAKRTAIASAKTRFPLTREPLGGTSSYTLLNSGNWLRTGWLP